MGYTNFGLGRLDPRIRIYISFIVGFSVFFMNQTLTAHLIVSVSACILLLSGLFKSFFRYGIAYVIIAILMANIENINNTNIMLLLVSVSYFAQKFIVMLMIGSYISNTTSVTTAITTMETIKLSKTFIIPFSVAMRFLPSIKEDIYALRDSLKIRHIPIGIKGFLVHPIQTAEFFIVPILMRSFKIADELASTAIVRGLDRDIKRTILYPLKMTPFDVLISMIITLIIIILFWVQFTN